MKAIKIASVAVAVMMLACALFGCAPVLEEEAKTAAIGYYENMVMRQDYVAAAEYCAYDRIGVLEAVYSYRAQVKGQSLEDYISDTCSKKNYDSGITTIEGLLKAQSDEYVQNITQEQGTGYFALKANVIKFSKADDKLLRDTYNSLVERYANSDINFDDYLSYDDITQAQLVTLGTSASGGDVSDVVIVKLSDGTWGYLN